MWIYSLIIIKRKIFYTLLKYGEFSITNTNSHDDSGLTMNDSRKLSDNQYKLMFGTIKGNTYESMIWLFDHYVKSLHYMEEHCNVMRLFRKKNHLCCLNVRTPPPASP